MTTRYIIADYSSYRYYDFTMTNIYKLNTHSYENYLFKFTKKYFLGSYEDFIEQKNKKLNLKNPLFKIFKKQKNFPKDSYELKSIDFFLEHAKPILNNSQKNNKVYKEDFEIIEKYLNNKNYSSIFINKKIYEIIQNIFIPYFSDVKYFIENNKVMIVETKLSNF